jgi:hypothetical protein
LSSSSFSVTSDPFSLAEDAAFCPLPVETLAKDHGVAMDEVRLFFSLFPWSGAPGPAGKKYASICPNYSLPV